MAFVTKSRRGRWEIRESRTTPSGPRSRTLATFAELDEAAIERARSRTSSRLEAEELRRAALRAGAPLAQEPADRAARELLGRIVAGERPRRGLRLLLAGALDGEEDPSDSAQAAAEWIAATPEQRGDALRDLLLLADMLPAPTRRATRSVPRLESS